MARPLGFTGEKKQLFLEALARTGVVKDACEEVGVGTGSVAWARERDAGFGAEVERVLAGWREDPPTSACGDVLPLSPALSPEGRGISARHDGFTAEKRKRCLKVLAETGCISDAARVAGVSRNTVDRWRRKDAGFSKLCEAAIDMASSHIETLAWERAVTGIKEPIWHCGKLVGTRIKRSDAIFRMLLIGSNKKKYGRMGGVGRKQLARAEKKRIEHEVREEWRAKNVMSFDQAIDKLEQALAAFGERSDAGFYDDDDGPEHSGQEAGGDGIRPAE